ncbi:MAG: Flp pilus assembly protein RcpC/CpaB [Micavibrio sp.]|nr:Flp pilus assembly protein RcpC/CpaB [Micavibrio sp.]
MNKNVLIAFGGATLIALVVAIMLNAMLKGGHKAEETAAAPVARTEILFATAEIKPGQLLSEENIAWKTWPEDAVYPGVVVREDGKKPLEALSGRVIRPIAQGEPVVKSALVKDSGGFLAAMLKPETRAVAVTVSAATTAGGFINPGDYVDIILTSRSHVTYESDNKALETRMKNLINRNLDQYSSSTILQNIKVIGLDQKAVKERGEKDEDTAGKVAKTATLEVTPRQAEILALAGQMGELSLALRGIGDEKIVQQDAPTVSDNRMSNIYKEITEEIDKAGGRHFSVHINNGGNVSDIPVR